MNGAADYIFVLPTLKATGGNLEVIRLANELRRAGKCVVIFSIWESPHPVSSDGIEVVAIVKRAVRPWTAALSLPLVMLRFFFLQRRWNSPATKAVFTHYVTYPMAFLTKRVRRWVFVQDLEWNFVPAGMPRSTLRSFTLFTYRRAQLLAANPFLCRRLHDYRLPVAGTAEIWADPFFGELQDAAARDIDVALILRKGAHKRADWGLLLLRKLRSIRPDLRALVISPDDEFARVAEGVASMIRPSREQIRSAYRRSRVFVLFSEHEGFGLPPLEAMGSGCVPLCRDAGGIRAYMEPELEANIIPLDAPPEVMIGRLGKILDDGNEWSRLSTISREVFRRGLDRTASRLETLRCCGFIDAAAIAA